jgi:hypothetical protein
MAAPSAVTVGDESLAIARGFAPAAAPDHHCLRLLGYLAGCAVAV